MSTLATIRISGSPRSVSCRISTAFRMERSMRTLPRIGYPHKHSSRSAALGRLLFLPGRYRSGRVLTPGRTPATEGVHLTRGGRRAGRPARRAAAGASHPAADLPAGDHRGGRGPAEAGVTGGGGG